MDASTGRFSGYITTTATKVLGRSATQVGWESEGHFLIYCVIARADGKDLGTDDPMIKVIVYDMVEKYLRDTVILNWSVDHSSPGPSGVASPSSPAPTDLRSRSPNRVGCGLGALPDRNCSSADLGRARNSRRLGSRDQLTTERQIGRLAADPRVADSEYRGGWRPTSHGGASCRIPPHLLDQCPTGRG